MLDAHRHVGHVTPEALNSRMASGEPVALLDVREPFERDLATIPRHAGVVELAIPMGDVPARMDDVARVAEDRHVIVYCHHGHRSMVVARWLAARGVGGLLNLDGGIDAWSTEVDPSTPRY
ncbi:MAG TPA: rhodanese-like domain-containing protein [Isosphaeraceae bacterium]